MALPHEALITRANDLATSPLQPLQEQQPHRQSSMRSLDINHSSSHSTRPNWKSNSMIHHVVSARIDYEGSHHSIVPAIVSGSGEDKSNNRGHQSWNRGKDSNSQCFITTKASLHHVPSKKTSDGGRRCHRPPRRLMSAPSTVTLNWPPTSTGHKKASVVEGSRDNHYPLRKKLLPLSASSPHLTSIFSD